MAISFFFLICYYYWHDASIWNLRIWSTWKLQPLMTGQSSGSISGSSSCLESTTKMILGVDFLVKILATMGQLWPEKSLKSKSPSSAIFQSFACYRCYIQNEPMVANIFTRKSTSRNFLMVLSTQYDDLEIDLNFVRDQFQGPHIRS